jgi:hypothetical protein
LDLLQFFAECRPHSPNNSPNINRYGAGGGDPQNRIVASFSATILSFPPRARGNQLVRVGICFEWRYRTNRKTHEIIETADHRDESGIKSVVQGVAMTQMTKASAIKTSRVFSCEMQHNDISSDGVGREFDLIK